MAEWHPAFEEYCETIYELAEDDVEVIQARIAERMGIYQGLGVRDPRQLPGRCGRSTTSRPPTKVHRGAQASA